MNGWPRQLLNLHQAGIRCALVTITGTRGSTPRTAGTRMLVTTEKTFGTVGGGQLEYRLVDRARGMLSAVNEADERVSETFTLGPELSQCCGGVVDATVETLTPDRNAWLRSLAEWPDHEPCVLVSRTGSSPGRLVVGAARTAGGIGPPTLERFATSRARDLLARTDPPAMSRHREADDTPWLIFEYLAPEDFHVIVFGAGHVGKALITVMSAMPCRVTWVDSRAGEFPAVLPANVEVRVSETPWELAALATARSFVLVMTHSHPADFRICAAVLAGEFAYLGLIGSKSKRNRFRKHLAQQGVPADRLDRLVCPIGIDGISGKHPGEIAVAVAAQLLRLRESRIIAAAAKRVRHRDVAVES